jgi:hypothetical protein
MNRPSVVTLTAAAIIAGVSVASAAPGSGTISGANGGLQSNSGLDLSQREQQTAWNDLYMGSLNQKTPSGFNAVLGARMPNSVVTAPVTARAINDVPALKPYAFAMVQKKLVIVNPTDHKIAAVIAEAP